jgi:hypothetical protein
MNRQSSSPKADRPVPIEDDNEHPNLDPIRDDPEPLTMPPREAPRKKKAQIGEGSYEGTEQYAEGMSNYLKTADVEADAKAAAPRNEKEDREMKAAEAEAASHSRGSDKRGAKNLSTPPKKK